MLNNELVVLDIDGSIQGKLHMTGIKVEPHAVDLIPCSRNLFQESVPYLLKDNAHWFFSRSLVFKGYNGVIDEAVKFPAHDPVGGLPDLPFLPSACIRWAEVFLFVAGDFNVKEEGLDSRDAVKELLHELNSKEGISKLLAFDVVASSVVGGKEKLEAIKDMHVNLIA